MQTKEGTVARTTRVKDNQGRSLYLVKAVWPEAVGPVKFICAKTVAEAHAAILQLQSAGLDTLDFSTLTIFER